MMPDIRGALQCLTGQKRHCEALCMFSMLQRAFDDATDGGQCCFTLCRYLMQFGNVQHGMLVHYPCQVHQRRHALS